MSSILISVIIPVFKDWDRLMLCLNALNAQKNANSAFEVIVVNNDPKDSFVPSDTFSFPIKFLKQPIPGSYSARNMGLYEAEGEALLFTDSDCIPEQYWISQAIKLMKAGSSDLFAGDIKLFSQVENKYVRYEKAFAFSNSYYVSKENFGVTANLLVKKDIIDSIGGFNAGLFTGGDSEFCNRAVNAGFKIEYSPELMILHPARTSWTELRVKAIRFGGRLPKSGNSYLMILKLLGKFRIRFSDIAQIINLSEVGLADKFDFLLIKQRLRWVEAIESFRVFMGKKPGRK